METRLFLVPFKSCFLSCSDCSVSRALAEVCNSLPLQNEMKLLNCVLRSDLVTNVGGQYRPVVACGASRNSLLHLP